MFLVSLVPELVLAPLSFHDLEPLTRNLDNDLVPGPCNQELDYPLKASFPIVLTSYELVRSDLV